MKTLCSRLILGNLLLFCFNATADSELPLSLPDDVLVISGSPDYVICADTALVDVRDETFGRVAYRATHLEPVKQRQSFEVSSTRQDVNGKTFVYVLFPERSSPNNSGWVPESVIQTKTQCAVALKAIRASPAAVLWTFPTAKRPNQSYKTGARKFSAARDGGNRLHAACDIYRSAGDDALAVNSGTVIRDRYYFYQGTYAIEVKHSSGQIVRYGEITGKSAPGVALSKTIKAGQTVGYVGKVNSGCCQPMLHFEMYSGTAKGALSQSGNKFNRRQDLMDPTDLLSEWEKLRFGESY